MAKYVDGFVLIVPKDKAEEYRKMAEMGRDSWMKHGALSYFECSGDDLVAMEMGEEKARSFPELTGAQADEAVWFSFITFESKEHRDKVNAEVMKEMGARDIYVACTHPVLSGPAFERIRDSVIKELIVTNTIPLPAGKPVDKIKVLSVAPLFAEAIKRIYEGLSLSKLFD